MRKEVISLAVLAAFFLSLVVLIVVVKKSEKADLHHNYGLLGEGYGIVTSEDIAVNDCQATPMPFSDQSDAYQYWQCFDVKDSRVYCDGKGFDEDTQLLHTYMVISGIRSGIKQEYVTRRTIPLTTCQEYIKDWKRLVEGEKVVCISGSLLNHSKNQRNEEIYNWIFDRFKTKKGCESYFEGGCSLKYQLEHCRDCN